MPLALLEEKKQIKAFLTALGFSTLRHSPIIMLMEILSFPSFPANRCLSLSQCCPCQINTSILMSLLLCLQFVKAEPLPRAASTNGLPPSKQVKMQVQIISAIATLLPTASTLGEQLRDHPTCSLTAPWDRPRDCPTCSLTCPQSPCSDCHHPEQHEHRWEHSPTSTNSSGDSSQPRGG